MKPIYACIAIFLSIFYFAISLYFSSLIEIDVKNYIITYNFDKLNIAVFGAFIAFYNAIFNAFKAILEKIKTPKLSMSYDLILDNSNIKMKFCFINTTQNLISINDIRLRGYECLFNKFEIPSNSEINKEIDYQRVDTVNLKKNIFGKTKLKIHYTFIESYKNKLLIKRIRIQ